MMRRKAMRRALMPTSDPFRYLESGTALTGDLPRDVVAYLGAHGCPRTAAHSAAVAAEARRLALSFGVEAPAAEAAGWLHDVSAVIPVAERLPAARAWRVPVLPEERAAPMLLHQKLSAVLARRLFGVADAAMLQAIGCHTTLRSGATMLDQVLFVADKVAWDQPGEPPYLAAVRAGLERSLAAAARAYLRYLWEQRDTLPAVHPWMAEAYRALSAAEDRR